MAAVLRLSICDASRDLVPFVQFKKREKHPCRMLLLKSNTPPWVFFTFFKIAQMVPNCAKHNTFKMAFLVEKRKLADSVTIKPKPNDNE